MATLWIVTCPECYQEFEVPSSQVFVECGQALAYCSCPYCDHQFQAEQDYLVWLGVEGPIPPELVQVD